MTVQHQDALYYHGQWRAINETPLESYLAGLTQRPAFYVYMSSLRRGYIGKWVIDDEKLYLDQLDNIEIEITQDSVKAQIVPNSVTVARIFPKAAGSRVFAEWYTGRLQFSQDDGNDPTEVASGGEMRAVCIDIDQGNVISTSIKRKSAYRSRQHNGAYALVKCESCRYEGAIPIPQDRVNDWQLKTHPVCCKECGELTLSNCGMKELRCAECGSQNISRAIENQIPLAYGGAVWRKFLSSVTLLLRLRVHGRGRQPKLKTCANNIASADFVCRCPQCRELSLKFV